MKQKVRYTTAMTIAGSDSGGGAGIQADLKTFSSLGIFGTSAITAITAQNTQHVRSVEVLPADIVREQMEAILNDIPVDVVKTGMLPTPGIIETVAHMLDKYPCPALIVDPVLMSTSGTELTSSDITVAFRELLYKRLTLITPNIPELSRLSDITINCESDIHRAVGVLLAQGCRAVYVKGGHLSGPYASDILFTLDTKPVVFATPFIPSGNLHGTGCTLAAAIASYLALGHGLVEAVESAKSYITSAIDNGKDVYTGQGNGPLNHFFDPQSIKNKGI